jgi:Outer membrane protein beta-barrel domain
MIKSLILISSFLLGGGLVAQKVLVGPELGLNLIMVEEQSIGDNFQLGMFGGGVFEYEINDWVSLKSGIHFSQTRQASTSSDTSAFDFFGLLDSTFTIPGIDMNTYTKTYSRQSQGYIQIPLMVKVRWNGLNVFGGGYASFMVTSKRKNNAVSNTPFMSTLDIESLDQTGFISMLLPAAHDENFSETSERENLRVFDYGLKFGLGYQWENVGFQCSYNFGIPDYRVDRGLDELERHQFFQFSLNYLFELGNKSTASSIR